MTPARGTDAQRRDPARGITRGKRLFQAFIDIDLGDVILPRFGQRCGEALPLFVLRAPGRRAARTGRWIGHDAVPACVRFAPPRGGAARR
jgi:hypothetical protein